VDVGAAEPFLDLGDASLVVAPLLAAVARSVWADLEAKSSFDPRASLSARRAPQGREYSRSSPASGARIKLP
jgi:hypothetical protein